MVVISFLDAQIEKIEAQARADDPDALAEASKLIEEYPSEVKTWALRAYIYGREENYGKAIEDYTRAIDLCPTEPCLFFDRVIEYSKIGDYRRAIDDCTRGLALCDLHSSDYYREVLHFFRANAYLELGNRVAALEDLQYVRNDFLWWINDIRTKQDLLARCSIDG